MFYLFTNHAELDIKTLVNELKPVKDRYGEIGIQLGIEMTQIKAIELEHSTVDRRLSETLDYWLRGNTEVPICWKSIIDALQQVGGKNLAEQLATKYGVLELKEAQSKGI